METIIKTAGILGRLAANLSLIAIIYFIFWLVKYAIGFENAVIFCLAFIFFYVSKLTPITKYEKAD